MALGKVYLVGAGPGDPGLLTLRAVTLLGAADVLVHDGLLGTGIEALFPKGAQVERVQGGPHATPTREVVRRLARHARAGRTVLRLHVGDPFLFESGPEELEGLRRLRIPVEAVPGVSSLTAAATAHGLSLTDADCTRGVLVLPGRHPGIDWEHAARFAGTLVLMMSASSLTENVGRLLAAGRPALTPTTMIERATLPEAKVLRGTLRTIVAKARRARVRSPAVVIVGPRKPSR